MMNSVDPPPPQNTLICRFVSSFTTRPLANVIPDVNQLIDDAATTVAPPGATDRNPDPTVLVIVRL